MSAEAVQALVQQAHALNAEADSAEAMRPERVSYARIDPRHPDLLRLMAKEFGDLALRMQGINPAAVAAKAEANRQMDDYAAQRDALGVQKDDAP